VQVRCDAIHLGAERPAAEALEHPAIRKIELEHVRLEGMHPVKAALRA